MSLSKDSKIGDILANEQGKAILTKHIPELVNHPLIKMVLRMSVVQVAKKSKGQITAEALEKADLELKAID